MAAEVVVDASVAAKCFLTEDGSDGARRLARSGLSFVAPDLVLIELASVAAKRVRRGDVPVDVGRKMTAEASRLFDELVPARDHAPRAFELAAAHPLSLYDAIYVAVAEQRGSALVTADARLVERARGAGVGSIVRLLT